MLIHLYQFFIGTGDSFIKTINLKSENLKFNQLY